MDQAVTGSTHVLLQYGALGVLVLLLLAAVIALWRDNVGLRKEMAALQEKRVTEGQEVMKLAESMKPILSGLLENVKEALRK